MENNLCIRFIQDMLLFVYNKQKMHETKLYTEYSYLRKMKIECSVRFWSFG